MEQEGMPFRAGWKTNQGLDSALIYLQRPRQPDPAQPGLQIPLMQSLHPFQTLNPQPSTTFNVSSVRRENCLNRITSRH
jgi:hypothetical protein